MELGGSFAYDRQIFGDNRLSKYTDRTYSGNVAFYFWNLTAIEFNYSHSDNIITNNENRLIDTNLTITSQQDRLNTEVYGVGIRQALATRESFIQPMISIGYAQKITVGEIDYNLNDNGEERSVEFDLEKSRTDSVFAAFSLKFRLTKTMTLDGTVSSVFKWFETNEAKDNVKYLVGFSWFL